MERGTHSQKKGQEWLEINFKHTVNNSKKMRIPSKIIGKI